MRNFDLPADEQPISLRMNANTPAAPHSGLMTSANDGNPSALM